MNTTKIGRDAEDLVAKHLSKGGYKLIAKNWRTRRCEIDLVMEKERVVYFIEVKFRRHTAQGEGVDYITPSKLSQMRYAAEYWMSVNNCQGDAELLVASVNGETSRVSVLSV